MAIINTGLITKGLRSEFFSRFEGTKSYYQELSTRVPSSSDTETYRWLGSVPRMREWGDGRVARGMRTESYSVENLKYESTIEVDRDEIADDKTGQIRIRIGEMAARAATHKDYLIAQLLINGGTSGFNSYDGVSFFNQSHESGDSGTQNNALIATVVDAENPTVAEFTTTLKSAISAMLSFKDDQGDPMSMGASGMVCVVPSNMYLTALEAVNATIVGGTTNVLEGTAKIVAFPWLTEKSKWFLLKTDDVIRPLIFQDREPIEFTALAEDSEESFKREKLYYGVRARYRMTYGYWQYAVQIKLSAA